MNRAFIMAGLLVLLAATAVPADTVSVYSDPSGSSCSIADVTPALFTVFVIHDPVYFSVGANLRVVESDGFRATFVEETNPFYHDGTFSDGVNVFYGECFSSPFVVGTITYQGHGTSDSCSLLDTTGNPNWVGGYTPYPISSDCTFDWYPAPSVSPLLVNPSLQCPAPCVVRSESATWGKVKALYRD